jgi:Circularly permutated YpsA SLOG family
MLKKIISGGQIGADQAALDAAIKYNFPHGGWIQKGRKTQSGTLSEKYHLKEMFVSGHKERIEENVIKSDGTVIISHGDLAGGADYS